MSKNNFFAAIHEIARFALPVTIGGIINMASIFITFMMVARLGQASLAASALAFTTFITVKTVTVTIFYAIGILISHHEAQHSPPNEIGTLVKNGIWVAIFISLPSGILLWHADKLLLLFGQAPALVVITREFFHYMGLGLCILLMNTVLSQFFIGTNRPGIPMLISIINLLLTVFASYCFVLGHFGIPMLGLPGLALASIVSQSIILIFLFVFLYIREDEYLLFSQSFLPQWQTCKSILSLGLPIGIQSGGESAAITVSTYFVGYFGVTALAASQVVNQYSLFFMMIIVGLTQAITILISKTYGQHDFYSMKKYLQASMLLFFTCCVVMGVLFCIFPTYLITFYVDKNAINHQTIYLGSVFFIINAFVLLADGTRNLLSGALRGLHHSREPMKIGIMTLWLVSLPVSYVVGFTLHGGPIGLKIAFLSGYVMAIVIQWHQMKRTIDNLKNNH